MAFGEQDHYGVKVSLYWKPQVVYKESAQVPGNYLMEKQSENHHRLTVQKLDSKSLLVLDEGRILEAENYILGSLILVKTTVHFGEDRWCKETPRLRPPHSGSGGPLGHRRRPASPAGT